MGQINVKISVLYRQAVFLAWELGSTVSAHSSIINRDNKINWLNVFEKARSKWFKLNRFIAFMSSVVL